MSGGSVEFSVGWCRNLFRMLNDGGVWGVPRSGLMFQKRGGKLLLAQRMPYLDELADAYARGEDVPESAEALDEYQREDFDLIAAYFHAAGITVEWPEGVD